ncbi:unnamed protein product [uncultured bacterium]|nr:unnamed protein product [uncultured bacterium]
MLSALRKKADARGLRRSPTPSQSVRLALVGACGLYPLHDLLTHLLDISGVFCTLFVGEFDNYTAEILEPESPLYAFRPDVIAVFPSDQRCTYSGALTDPVEAIQAAVRDVATDLLHLCEVAHQRTGAEILLGNFMLPARRDPGPYRSRTLASDWNFRKCVNLELGTRAPAFVRICDIEFLANRFGALAAEDARGWFESKQPCAAAMLPELCREVAGLLLTLRTPPKKVLAVDLDNTLWGGAVGEDGVGGIEIGDTSPRGEAFKAFQRYVRSLKDRGVLLAVCSKNEPADALEPFDTHPEMVLRQDDFVAFHANWEPKSDNLRRIGADLGVGLDSIVFVDDNPAEIEIVRQLTPEVTPILLGPDPADFVGQLKDCGLFEAHGFTAEDVQRTSQYRADAGRRTLLASAADMDAYLASLAMEATIREFSLEDVPRIAQLTNKSNQFNVTTRRRTETEVQTLIGQPDHICLSARLKDRFGDHGLVSVLICRVCGDVGLIDTWLMSCRVLKRQVEDEMLNELARRARMRGCARLEGVYMPTAKNGLVKDLYERLGFQRRGESTERAEFSLDLESASPRPTRIQVRPYAHASH